VKVVKGTRILTSLQKRSKVFKSYQKLSKVAYVNNVFKYLLLVQPDARESEANSSSPEADS